MEITKIESKGITGLRNMFLGILLAITIVNGIEAQIPSEPPDWWVQSMEGLDERMDWWEESRFALFMHWGAYSVLGGEYMGTTLPGQYSEHIARILKIPKKDYITHAARQFRPEKFDAEKWVLLAKNAGMKYIVITAKHHDGFSIYHSKHTYFDVEDIARWDRDPLKELSDACKKHGLVFGVYYSHAQDWYEPYNVVNNWDFDNPTSNNWYKQDTPELLLHKKNMEKYYLDKKAIPQVIELINNYGVEMIWFDTALWMPFELRMKVLKAAREANPNLVVNQRVAGGDHGNYGDYRGGADSPVIFPTYGDRYWEVIQSTLHSWGYNKFDQHNRRSPDYLLRILATTVSKGGNLMINIGPKGDGTFTEGDVATLKYFADWMEFHSGSIHGAKRSPLPYQNWGVVTTKGKDLYLHVFDWPVNGELKLAGLTSKVKSAELMQGSEPLGTKKLKNNILIIKVPEKPSHPDNSVIRLICADEPAGDGFRLLESEKPNRLHVFDYTSLEGEDIKTARGKETDAYVYQWYNADSKIVWQARQVGSQKYNVQIIYDLPKDGVFNDSYQLQIGGKVLNGMVNREGTGNEDYVDTEKKLMRITEEWVGRMQTQMIVDDLGDITLENGTYSIELSAKGEIKNKELFRPRVVILTPL